MSSFGLEFPIGTQRRDDLLNTLQRLNLYAPEVNWEDYVMRMYERMSQQMQTPSTAIVSPNTFTGLQAQLKSTK
jgi:hypothetical protein